MSWIPNIENFSSLTYTGSTNIAISYPVVNNDIRIINLQFTFDPVIADTSPLVWSLESTRTFPSTTIVLYTKDLTGITSLIYTPDTSVLFEAGDNLLFTWTNVNSNAYTLNINYVTRFTVWRMDDIWR